MHVSGDELTNTIRDYVRDLKSLPYEVLDDIFREITDLVGEIDYADVDSFLNWNQKECKQHVLQSDQKLFS